MPYYWAYLLNAAGEITWGDWIEALDQEDAEAKAHELCTEGVPTVELWQSPCGATLRTRRRRRWQDAG